MTIDYIEGTDSSGSTDPSRFIYKEGKAAALQGKGEGDNPYTEQELKTVWEMGRKYGEFCKKAGL